MFDYILLAIGIIILVEAFLFALSPEEKDSHRNAEDVLREIKGIPSTQKRKDR